MPLMSGQRGIALIVVLWMLVLLSITVGIYAVLARTESLQARFLFDTTAARYAAEAGVHRAVFELSNPDIETRWVADGRPYVIDFGGAEVEIRIIDESGKIDLNRARAELMTEFLISRGVDQEEALYLVDAIVDWRDPDDQPQPYGAEIDDYHAAGYPYGPANEDFQSVDELQQVIGMSRALYRDVSDLVTVHGSGRVNPAFAQAEVLAAWPDMTLEDAELFIEQRRQHHPADPAALMLPDGTVVDLRRGSGSYTIRVTATLDNGTWNRVDATVAPGDGMRGQPFQVLRWRESVEER